MHSDATVVHRAQLWADQDPDPSTRAAVQQMLAESDIAALQRCFGTRLQFGTAGLRGVMGPGPGGMNRLVVRQTSAGIASFLQGQRAAGVDPAAELMVVVGYDGRHLSRQFAQDTVGVLGALGVCTVLFDQPVPTPLVSFAVLKQQACAGIVVTASHNPPQYNGYKVYGADGAQIVPPTDVAILAAIDAAAQDPVPCWSLNMLRQRGLLQDAQEHLETDYLQSLQDLLAPPAASAGLRAGHRADKRGVHWAGNLAARAAVRLAYTPLHGVGARLAERALLQAGFTQVSTVESQRRPDGNFPTVAFPNPEEVGAMDQVTALATRTQAHLACANDPDADRFAVSVRQDDGTYLQLSGNEVGIVLADALSEAAPPNAAMGTTLVSSQFLRRLCAARQVHYFETLTGFKWLAQAAQAHVHGGGQFIFAYEEALGYAFGEKVWDKDGIAALCVFAARFAQLQAQGQSIGQRLEALYRAHGYFLAAQKTRATAAAATNLLPVSQDRPGAAAAAVPLCEKLRRRPPSHVGGMAVQSCDDLLAVKNTATAEEKIANLKAPAPRSDVLVYRLCGGARVIVRPSGTEPKVKCYYEIEAQWPAAEKFSVIRAQANLNLLKLMALHQQELHEYENQVF
jgi:phosphomannomutase